MKNTEPHPSLQACAAGRGPVSQGEALLLTRAAWVTGLDSALSAGLAGRRAPQAVHDPRKIALDVGVTLALADGCLPDPTLQRAEPERFRPIASDPVTSQLVTVLDGGGALAQKAVRRARTAARQWAWHLADAAAPGTGGLIPVDLDAMVVIAHSDKENAAPIRKKAVGFRRIEARLSHKIHQIHLPPRPCARSWHRHLNSR